MKLAMAGRLCLIFDGFDEMSGVADIESRINHFRALWRFFYPSAKILITGRPNFFLDDKELITALGIASSTGSGWPQDPLRKTSVAECYKKQESQGPRGPQVAGLSHEP